MSSTTTFLHSEQHARRPLKLNSAVTAEHQEHTSSAGHAERQLGDSELAYFLPSRESGVNDMYVHVGFRAVEHLVASERVRVVWAILRARHPLLASKVIMRDYDDISFAYTRRNSREELADADTSLEYYAITGEEFLELYLNGPRILSSNRLSHLAILAPRDDPTKQHYEVVICATHFIGDGLSMHQMGNEFFSLLGSTKSNIELEEDLTEELRKRASERVALPEPSEMSYPIESKFSEAAGNIAFQLHQQKQIGGHAFPRCSAPTRHTVTRVASFDIARTKAILGTCKSHGVSVSAAMFALCNIAWARSNASREELPMLMYSALNIRPFLPPAPDSFMLAVSYFNVILPSFLPKSLDVISTFWARAKSAKLQSLKAALSPLVVSRSRRTGNQRAKAAQTWGKEDDEKARGVFKAPPPQIHVKPGPPKTPSAALVGLSLMGNLDGIYRHANFPSITLHTQTGGTRQRPGGMLIFSYTFAGKLWITFQYDENGFEREVVEKFWQKCLDGVDEFL